jgi:hypothetical protein
MLSISGRNHRYCNGLSRREFLRVGGLGAAGLSLADLLRHEAKAAPEKRRGKSIIYIVLGGGPSHIDMWDLKPEAPTEIRGPFQPIQTSLTGVQICEFMPLSARMMDQFALLRGIRSVENDHFLSEVYTGLPRGAGQRPAFGSIVSKLARSDAALPTYVSLDERTTSQFEFENPHYAGAGHAPFRPFGDVLNDMNPVESLDQLGDRKRLLTAFDGMRRKLDRHHAFDGIDHFQKQALQIVTSPQVREAFDLSKEPADTIAKYGRGKYPHQTVKDILYDWDVKPFVLARRLVEAGVRVVTLRVGSWDHHSGPQSDIFYALKLLMPVLDQSVTALVNDLKSRGLDQDVLVVVLGEFGRTPKIVEPGPGREHWAEAGCALFAGGGLRMGQVIGQTDSRAERSADGNITFQNIMATIYQVLGVPLQMTLPDFNGRPQYLLDDRQPIRDLL